MFEAKTVEARRGSGEGGALPGDGESILLHLVAEYQQRAAERGGVVECAYIYVLEAIGLRLFKIGQAADLKARLPSYGTECPVPCRLVIAATVPASGVTSIERSLHEHYRDRRKKGEWFALTDDDIQGLVATIKKYTTSPLRNLSREVNKLGLVPAYNVALVERERMAQVELARRKEQDSVPTVDLVIDRFEYAGQCGEMIEMSDLTRSIARKPQDIHEAVRTLIHDGVVAIVSPNRGSPGMGKVWFDAYRYSKLKLTDVTCDWEETWCEREVQVSEPLGEVVPECFGQERVG